ncbi:MAG: H/ACA ribonucleoprotein complex subunit GAR1 [Candidatus Lokiarchaeia archaeon]
MRRLGKPLHLTTRGDLILRVNFTPKIGSKVVTKDMREVGQIFDVLGPVKTPYVSVKPQVEPNIAGKLVDEVLYELVNRKKRGYSKRRK